MPALLAAPMQRYRGVLRASADRQLGPNDTLVRVADHLRHDSAIRPGPRECAAQSLEPGDAIWPAVRRGLGKGKFGSLVPAVGGAVRHHSCLAASVDGSE